MTGPGVGHNGGPTLERGRGWRRYAWKRARADLLPTLPLEVARRRVKRARELGLNYKAYAGIRAATGRDIVALLFSDNALRLTRDARIPIERAEVVQSVRSADRIALVRAPLTPDMVLNANQGLDRAGSAPSISHSWGETRQRVLNVLEKTPADGVLVIGETRLEREWFEAGGLAGYLTADRFFGRLSG